MIRSLLATILTTWSLTLVATSGAAFTRQTANPSNVAATLAVQSPATTSAVSAPAGAVTLSWDASPTIAGDGHELTYVVFRGPPGGPYTQIGQTAATVTTVTDIPVADGTYGYVVRAKVSGAGSFTGADSPSAYGVSDRGAPSLAVTCDGAACRSGWYSGAVTVVVNGADAGTGMASVTHQIDAATPITRSGATSTFSVTGDSAGHAVTYYGTDVAGNGSPPATQTIRIDATSPTPATNLVAAPGTKGTPATVSLTWTAGTDALSGVQGYELRWTNAVTGCPAASTASYPNSAIVGAVTSAAIPPAGTLANGSKYCAYVVTIDNAGNRGVASAVAGPTPAK